MHEHHKDSQAVSLGCQVAPKPFHQCMCRHLSCTLQPRHSPVLNGFHFQIAFSALTLLVGQQEERFSCFCRAHQCLTQLFNKYEYGSFLRHSVLLTIGSKWCVYRSLKSYGTSWHFCADSRVMATVSPSLKNCVWHSFFISLLRASDNLLPYSAAQSCHFWLRW